MALRLNPLSSSTTRSLSKLAGARRSLHMTGPATYPSAVLTETRTSKSSSASPTEAARRPASKSASAAKSQSQPESRHFNTSRALKAVKDSSTIDFAYLPEREGAAAAEAVGRVPILLGTMYAGNQARAMHEETSEATLLPLINLISGSAATSTVSAMSEVHDNNAVAFEGITAQTASAISSARDAVTETEGTVRQLWSSVLDDIFGPAAAAKKAGAA